MSSFKHACFISYRNGTQPDDLNTHNLLTTFAKQLKQALQNELDAYMPYDEMNHIFLDVDDLKPGEFIHSKISRELCQSICMIVVYTRSYFSRDKLFCASELIGMLEKEKERCQQLGIQNPQQGCIITVLLRGRTEEIPTTLSQRVWHNFDKFSLSQTEIQKNPNFEQKVREIAEYIADHCEVLMERSQEQGLDLCENCLSFEIPDITEPTGKKQVSDYVASITQRQKPNFPLTG